MFSLRSLASLFGRRRSRSRSDASGPDAILCGPATLDGALPPCDVPVPFDPPHDFASWRAALALLGGDEAGESADHRTSGSGDSSGNTEAGAGWESGAIVVLRRGSVDDPTFAGAVMTLIERFCTARLAEMTQRFLRDASDARDADSLALLAERYVRSCESLLFFDDVRGLPTQECSRLRETLRDGYRRVIDAPVAPDGALAEENLAYGRLRIRRMIDDAMADDNANNKGGGSHE